MISKFLYYLLCERNNSIIRYKTLKNLKVNQFRPYAELKKQQDTKLQRLITYVYESVPYYNKVFNSLNLKPKDITKTEDLGKLPILNKKVIRENWIDFKPVTILQQKYTNSQTGGSTGEPLEYRISNEARFLSKSQLFHIWGFAGFEVGDKVCTIGGASLGIHGPPRQSKVTGLLERYAGYMKTFWSWDFNEKTIRKYLTIINKFRPKYIRGYPSLISPFAKWIEDEGYRIHEPKAIFSTSEVLFPEQREQVERVFNCEVFNQYGLNDGGLIAGECERHKGLHICTERSILETVDEEENQIVGKEGTILATDLYNYALPFIRYDTGDFGLVLKDKCSCGRNYNLLADILGRQNELLDLPEGGHLNGGFFNHFLWIPNVDKYQIIQESLDRLKISLVVSVGFDKKYLDYIRKRVNMKSPMWNVDINIVDEIKREKSGKHRYCINKYDSRME